MKTRPELITRSGKSNVLKNFITNLRENDLHYENNKITQCVFLGVLKLKPIPSVFSKNKPTSTRNLTLRDRSRNIKKYPVKDTNKVISGKITKKNPETVKASVKKNPVKKSQIIKGKSKMNEDSTSGEKNDQHLSSTISDTTYPLNQTKTAVGSATMQFNPVQNLFDKMKGKSDKYINDNILCKKKKDTSSGGEVSDNSGNKLILSEAEKKSKSNVGGEFIYSSSPDSHLHKVHTKISHFTTESPDKIKELFAENNPTEEIIMIDTDLGETKQKERSSPRFRRVSIMEGNSRTKKIKEKPSSSNSSSVKQNINTKNNLSDWYNQNETVLIDDDYNTVSSKPHTIICDDDVICLGELKNKKENVMKDQEKSNCIEIIDQSPTKPNKSKNSFDSEDSTVTISDNPNKDVIIISTMLTEPAQDLIGTNNLQSQSAENKDTTGDISIIPEKSTQKSKSRRSRQIPAPIPSIFLQTPRLLRSELSQKNIRKEHEKPPKKISPRMQKSNNSSSSVKVNHITKSTESTKKHKNQATHDMMNEDTIFFSEEIKTPNQEGKPSLKLIIRQKKKTDVFQSHEVSQSSESSSCPDSEAINKKSPTATENTEKNKKLDNNEKMADAPKHKNRKRKTLEIIDKIDITKEITQKESTSEKPDTSDSLLLPEDDGIEQLIQDLTNDDILHIPYCDLSRSSTRTSNSSEKVSDQSSTSISIVDSVSDLSLLTTKDNFEKSPRSSRLLRSNKKKELFQESTTVTSTQSFASEDGSSKTFDDIITIPDDIITIPGESSNSDIKEITIVDNEVIDVIEDKSFPDKSDTSSEIISVNDCSNDIQSEISKTRVLRSKISNKNIPQIVSNTQSTNTSDNADSKINHEASIVHGAIPSNLGVLTTEINEESSLIVQDDEIIVSDDDQVNISKPILFRTHKSKNEVGMDNLKFDSNEMVQKVQEKTHNEVEGIIEVVCLTSEENLAKTKSENSMKPSPKLPGVKISTTESSDDKSRMLRSNKSKQSSSCESTDIKSSSSDTGQSSEMVKEQTRGINEKVPEENLSIENESLKPSSNVDQIDNHIPRITRVNRSIQPEDKINENFDTLNGTDKKLPEPQEKPKKIKTSPGKIVNDHSPIKEKLNNEHTTFKMLRSHSSKENSQMEEKTDISPSDDKMEEDTSPQDLLQSFDISKSPKAKNRMRKNNQKSDTLHSDENFVDITEENVINIEPNVISCNKFYRSDQSNSEFLSTKSVNPRPDKRSITIRKTAKKALHKGKNKKIVIATKSLTRMHKIKNKKAKDMAKLASRKSKKNSVKLSNKQSSKNETNRNDLKSEGSKSKHNITLSGNETEEVIDKKQKKLKKEDTSQEIDSGIIEDASEKNVLFVEDHNEHVPELLPENLVKETLIKTKAQKQKNISSRNKSSKNKVKVTTRKKKSNIPANVQQSTSENEQESAEIDLSKENLVSEFVGDANEGNSLIVEEQKEHVPELLPENSVKETPGKAKAQKRKKFQPDNTSNNEVGNEVKITGRRKKSIIPGNVQQNTFENEQESSKNEVSNAKSFSEIIHVEDDNEKNSSIVEDQNKHVPGVLPENSVKETPGKTKAQKRKKLTRSDNSPNKVENEVKINARRKKGIIPGNFQQNTFENEHESSKNDVSNTKTFSEIIHVEDDDEKNSSVVEDQNEHEPEVLPENSFKETPGKTKAQKRKKLTRSDNSPNKVENEVKISARRKKGIIPGNVQQNTFENEHESSKNDVSNTKTFGKIIHVEDDNEKNSAIVEDQNKHVPGVLPENYVKETPGKTKAQKRKKLTRSDNSPNKVENEVKINARRKKGIIPGNFQQNTFENEHESSKNDVSNTKTFSEIIHVEDDDEKNSSIVEDQNEHEPEVLPENSLKETPGKTKAQKRKKLTRSDNSPNKVENEVKISARRKKGIIPGNVQQSTFENEQESLKNDVSNTKSFSEIIHVVDDNKKSSLIIEDQNEHVRELLTEDSVKETPGKTKAQKRKKKLTHPDNSPNKVEIEVKTTGRRKKNIIPTNIQQNTLENEQESSKNDVPNIKSSSENTVSETVEDTNEKTKNVDVGKTEKTTGRRKKLTISDVQQHTLKSEQESKKNDVPIIISSKENSDCEVDANVGLIVQEQKKHNPELLAEHSIKKTPRKNKRQKQQILNIQAQSPKSIDVTEETAPSESHKGDTKNLDVDKKVKITRRGKRNIISDKNIIEIEDEVVGDAIEKSHLNAELLSENVDKKTPGKTKARKQKHINLQNVTITEETVPSESSEGENKNVAAGKTAKTTGRRKKMNISDNVQQNTPKNDEASKKDDVTIINSSKEISDGEINGEAIEKNSSVVPKLEPEKIVEKTPGKPKVQKQKQLNNKDKSSKHLTITDATVPPESSKEEKKKGKKTRKRKKNNTSENVQQNISENEQDRKEDLVSCINSFQENPDNEIIGNANKKNSFIEEHNKHIPEMLPETSVKKTPVKRKIQKQNNNQGESPKTITVNEGNLKSEPNRIRDSRKREKSESSSMKVSKSKQKKKCDSLNSIQIAEIVNSIQAIEISEDTSVENDANTIENKNAQDETQDEIVQSEGKSWIDLGPPVKKRRGRPRKLEGENLKKEPETKVLKRKHSELSVTQLNTPLKTNKLYEDMQVPKKVRKSATSTPKRNADPNSSITESIERVVAGILPCKIDTTVFDFEDEDHEEPIQLRGKSKNENTELQKSGNVPTVNVKTESQNTSSQDTAPLKSPMKQTTIKEMFQKLAMKKRNLQKSDCSTIATPPPVDNSGTTSIEVVEEESEERLKEQSTCQMKPPPPPRPPRNEEFDDAESFFDDDSRSEWMPEEYAEYKFKYSAKKYKPLIYRCKICLVTLPSYLRLVKHKESHVKTENPYECKHCKERFSQVEDLVAHLKIHKGEHPYKCSKCNEGFWTKDEYDKHRPIHILRKVKEAPKKYQCDLCGKAFVKLCDMDRHTRVHTGEKPCVCNICGKRFQQNHNLSKHLIIHLRIKPYSCEICSQQFGRPDVLSRHVLTHSVEKPFKCKQCPKTFIRQVQLSKHMEEHSKKAVVVDSSSQEPQDSNLTEPSKVKTGKTRKKIKNEVSEVPNSANAVEMDPSIQEPSDSNNTKRSKATTQKTKKKIKTEVSEVQNVDA